MVILAGWINRQQQEVIEYLRTEIQQFLEHYHAERNHPGLDNQILKPGHEVGRGEGQVRCRERLGGLLRYHYRDAA